MGLTKIEWTSTLLPDGTTQPGFSFNPWHGCIKVSQGCKFCYADAQDRRFGPTHWGAGAERRMFGDAHWQEPVKWNSDAKKAGVRARVFCASMGDVFERLPADHLSAGAVEEARARLWALIAATPWLYWLLLTKRPENIAEMVPSSWLHHGFPENVWAGTSVEDQAAADERIPHLLRVPVRVRFLSCEPLLGPVDLAAGLRIGWQCPGCRSYFSGPLQNVCPKCGRTGYWSGSHAFNPKFGQIGSGISWVICGGESGHGARAMHPDWARSLRDQCTAAGVPFFFKQHGNWIHVTQLDSLEYYPRGAADGAVNNWFSRFNTSFHITEASLRGKMRWPDGSASYRVSKKDAGRLLDGRTWDEFPALSSGFPSAQEVLSCPE